jgi:hypothetical protein
VEVPHVLDGTDVCAFVPCLINRPMEFRPSSERAVPHQDPRKLVRGVIKFRHDPALTAVLSSESASRISGHDPYRPQ